MIAETTNEGETNMADKPLATATYAHKSRDSRKHALIYFTAALDIPPRAALQIRTADGLVHERTSDRHDMFQIDPIAGVPNNSQVEIVGVVPYEAPRRKTAMEQAMEVRDGFLRGPKGGW